MIGEFCFLKKQRTVGPRRKGKRKNKQSRKVENGCNCHWFAVNPDKDRFFLKHGKIQI